VRCQPHLNLIFIKRRNQSGKFIFGPAHNGCISEHAGNISGYFLRSSSAQTLVYKSNFIVQVVLLDRIRKENVQYVVQLKLFAALKMANMFYI